MNYKNHLFAHSNKISLILKVPGNSCNINCDYCFEKHKDVLDNQLMEPQFLDNLLKRIDSQVSILIHGGEPLLLGEKKMDDLLLIVSKYYEEKIIAVKLQTNGTLITNKWLDLLFVKYSKLNIEIAISLDGHENLNGLRVDFGNNRTYERVRQAFRLLNQRNIRAGMLSVISNKTLGHSKRYLNIIKEIPNIKFIKLIPLFNMKDNELTKDSVTPVEFSKFTEQIGYQYIQEKIYEKIAIEPLLSMFQKINRKESKYCNFSNSKCYKFITVYPEGLIGPCDCFSAVDFEIPISSYERILEDNIQQSLVGPDIRENVKDLYELIDTCQECDIYEFCTGGCLSQRYYFSGNRELSDNYCRSRRLMYTFAMNYKV